MADMVSVWTGIGTGTFRFLFYLFEPLLDETWEQNGHGWDTVVVGAGISALQSLMAIAGVKTANIFTPENTAAEGVQ
jgi:hypothetical protein